MKHMHKQFALLCLSLFSLIRADSCETDTVAPYFSVRSQSVYMPRMVSGWTNYTHQFGRESFNATFAIAPGYAKTFRSDDIARCLFGNSLQANCDCPQINISGSRVTDGTSEANSLRGSCDWLADYFGLPTDYKGSIQFKPRVSTVFIDFSLYVGLDEWIEGLWFNMWAPFVHTRWDLNFSEEKTAGSSNYVPGYFNSSSVPADNLLKNALDFFQKMKVPTIQEGTTFEPLRSCKWGECVCDFDTYLKANGIADLRATLGWDFYRHEQRHIGLGIIAAAPTGTRPNACNLFEPTIGNGKHWELGVAWTSHALLWQSEDEHSHIGFHLDANITHLFKAKQRRCFDLCGKPMSRYMLAQKLGTPVQQLWAAPQTLNTTDAAEPIAQFKNAYAPVANLTCADVKVSVGTEVYLIAMFNFARGGVSFDAGYNFWNRSCEKIVIDCTCPSRLAQEPDTWALKGDAAVYAFGAANAATGELQRHAVALSATQSYATIFSGTNICNTGSSNESALNNRKRNPAIDNPQWAMISLVGQPVANNTDALVFSGDQSAQTNKQSFTSKEPVFINQCNLDINGARTKGRSHSVFAHLNYSFNKDGNSSGYIGIGGQGEFGTNRSVKCDTDCSTSTSCPSVCDLISCDDTSNACTIKDDASGCCTPNVTECNPCRECNRCALSQWQVWVKGGFTFG